MIAARLDDPAPFVQRLRARIGRQAANRSGGSQMTVTLYGIPNCDTVRKARAWLADRGVAHRFHDIRKDGLDRAMLDGWIAAVGWEALVNRQGTTFRQLDAATRAGLDAEAAIALMLAQPAIIRRPVLDGAGPLTIGFKPALYEGLFACAAA